MRQRRLRARSARSRLHELPSHHRRGGAEEGGGLRWLLHRPCWRASCQRLLQMRNERAKPVEHSSSIFGNENHLHGLPWVLVRLEIHQHSELTPRALRVDLAQAAAHESARNRVLVLHGRPLRGHEVGGTSIVPRGAGLHRRGRAEATAAGGGLRWLRHVQLDPKLRSFLCAEVPVATCTSERSRVRTWLHAKRYAVPDARNCQGLGAAVRISNHKAHGADSFVQRCERFGFADEHRSDPHGGLRVERG